MPSPEHLKDEMVRQIVGERVVPTRLQYAMSQRLYYSMHGEFMRCLLHRSILATVAPHVDR